MHVAIHAAALLELHLWVATTALYNVQVLGVVGNLHCICVLQLVLVLMCSAVNSTAKSFGNMWEKVRHLFHLQPMTAKLGKGGQGPAVDKS